MIHIQDISFTYPQETEPVLRNISLRAGAGETVCLAGANGGGKSTLLALLTGLFSPTSGTITLAGHASPGREKEFRRVTGLVLQDADLQILGATVEEDLFLSLDPSDAAARDRALALAERFGLGDCLARPVQTLSYGQKRKLCLAATLLAEPKVLLLDEPFSGLDYPAAREMRDILRANQKLGLTQIIASHDLEPVIDLSDTLAVLYQGTLALSGPPAEVLPRVEEFGVRPPCSWLADKTIVPWS